MRIVILTQYYAPEMGAPQARLSDLARRLVAMGHDVTVLTSMPNYPAGRIQSTYRRRVYVEETIDGVTVRRVWLWASKSRRVLRRLTCYLSFVVTSLLAGLICLRRSDVLITESPPLFLGISGYLLAKWTRARFVLNVADLWPALPLAMNVTRNRTFIAAARWLEETLYRKATLITAQTQGTVLDIQRRMPAKAVRLVTNGADIERFAPDKADPEALSSLGLEGRFVVGYAGVHGLAQALDKVVEAAGYLTDCPDVTMAFFGDGPVKADLLRQARASGLGNVRFFPPQTPDTMPALVASWGAGVVSVYDGVLGRSAIPSKLFEVMASGVPVVVSAPRGEATALVDAAEAGICIEPENPVALAEAIRALYRDAAARAELGRQGRRFVVAHYGRQELAERWIGYLMTLIKGQPGAPVASSTS